MEIDLTFLLSAIYCGLGVVVIGIGTFAFRRSEKSIEKFEENLNSRFLETSVITLTIMVMMVFLWLPYLAWAVIDSWNKTKIEGGK